MGAHGQRKQVDARQPKRRMDLDIGLAGEDDDGFVSSGTDAQLFDYVQDWGPELGACDDTSARTRRERTDRGHGHVDEKGGDKDNAHVRQKQNGKMPQRVRQSQLRQAQGAASDAPPARCQGVRNQADANAMEHDQEHPGSRAGLRLTDESDGNPEPVARPATKTAQPVARLPPDVLAVLAELVQFARDKHARNFVTEMMGHLARKTVWYAALQMALKPSTNEVPHESHPNETVRCVTVQKYEGYSRKVKHGSVLLPDRESLACIILRVFEESGRVCYAQPAWAVGDGCRGSGVRMRISEARRAASEVKARRMAEAARAEENGTVPEDDDGAGARRITSIVNGMCVVHEKPVEESSPGYKMLLAMGWAAGTGLGANAEGEISMPVLRYRVGRQGLG
ncbi:hypothetical protein FVE85_4503 [Porphyridium purpureum]|uniref:G-patch domain-containing protein n=1 Tax=Porphyridium purpureum TaxID=35688 RepID=A0A5J4YI04_PORPP|nr:hypothetical protein FVE85_4503 [Porphyridium purpureum]|eukprot:POR3275..scf297_16